MARRAPGDNVLADQFQTVPAVLASDWCQKNLRLADKKWNVPLPAAIGFYFGLKDSLLFVLVLVIILIVIIVIVLLL